MRDWDGLTVFVDALEFEGAFLQGGGVAVDADGEFEGHLVLGFDDFGEGALMRFLGRLVICNDTLQLADEPPDSCAAEKQEQEERGQKKPAVVHPGGVVNGVKEFNWVHGGHLIKKKLKR